MIEKRVLIGLLIFMLIIPFALADDNQKVENAYSCLKNKLGDNCGNTKNTEQTAFNLLASSYDSSIKSKCISSLENEKKDNCWGKTSSNSCDIKPTALAILSFEYVNKNTKDFVNWLLEKKKLTKELDWFLEIDANNKTECDINGKKITINENKKISGTSPQGLVKAYNNYWFKITDLDKNFEISCDKSFIAALLYKKPKSNIYFISSKTDSVSADDLIKEKVDSYCFSASNACDYESSLWATLALAKAGENITSYIPYIYAMSDETANKKYLPSAFLYLLGSEDEYYSELLGLQKQGKYWKQGTDKFYDTSLALLALQGIDVEEINNAKEYLLSLQESSGCWPSNTAFILYSAWPKQPLVSKEETLTKCESFNHYCVSATDCNLEDKLDNFYCSGLSDVCCKTRPLEQTCSDKNGIVCSQNQECVGNEVIASDTNNCCLDSCQDNAYVNECEDAGYSCQLSCSKNQEEKSIYTNSCSSGTLCCAEKTFQFRWILIIILIFLIVLIILAIIFRNKLKIWWFKKTKFKIGKGPKKIYRPPAPPGISPLMQKPRQIIPRQPIYRRTKNHIKKSQKDNVFEETMKKLREMSQ